MLLRLLLVALCIASALAVANKNGELFADETWGAGSYTITAPGVYVMEGVTLTISGADIVCDDDADNSWYACFTVRGSLVVKDTFIGKHTSDDRIQADRSGKSAISHASETASEVYLDGVTLRSMSGGISERCCGTGSVTQVVNSVFDDLSTGIGGYTGDSSKSTFSDTVFKYCNLGAGNADHTFTNVTFQNNVLGADMERGSFTRCKFIDNDTAMKYGAPVDDALFQGNALAIAPGCCGHGFSTLSSATFYDNTLAVKSSAGWNSWTALNFIDNDVNVEYTGSSSSELDCIYWGHDITTASDIRSTIIRQVGGGLVTHESYSSAPHCHETFPCEYFDVLAASGFSGQSCQSCSTSGTPSSSCETFDSSSQGSTSIGPTTSGELFADETWGAGSYTITAPGVYVMEGVTLTISGADIVCDDDADNSWYACFTVRGSLVVKDTFIGKHTSDDRIQADRSGKSAISHASETASEVYLDGVTLRSMSGGISERCCGTGSVTQVVNSVFDDLSTGIGGYTGDSSKSTFSDTVFKYCNLGAGNADHTFTNVTFQNNVLGADMERGSFTRCKFIDNDTAMKYGAPVDDALFQGNALAIAPGCCGHGFSTLSSATFYDNTLAVKSSAGWNSWTALNFIDNDVNVEYTGSSSSELDCIYWGHDITTASDIRSTIIRQVGGGLVTHESYSSAPHCHETFPCEYFDVLAASGFSGQSCQSCSTSGTPSSSCETFDSSSQGSTSIGPTTSGELFADETWGAGSYTITAPGVYVMEGVTLTISGADIVCDDDADNSWYACFTVRGSLVVKDTFIGKHTSDDRIQADRSGKSAISHASETASEVYLDGVTLRSMSGGISERCCGTGSVTQVVNSVFDDLSTGIGGYTGDSSKSTFSDTVFKYCNLGAGNADHTFTNVTFQNNVLGADMERGSFTRCKFIDNDTAMKYGAPVDDALFQGNALAIAPGCCGHGFSTLSSATFYDNTLAVKSSAGWNSWTALNFIDNDVNVEYTGSSSSELDGMYWGHDITTASDIRSTIIRQVGGGDVAFDDFLSEPHCHETFPCEYFDGNADLAYFNCFECTCPIWNTTCRLPCGKDEYVTSHVCVKCPPGLVRPAGDNPSDSDTNCHKCGVDRYVSENVCVACMGGSTNPEGDNASGDDTTCACAPNERVVSNACVACDAGETNAAGNPVPGPDTACTKVVIPPPPPPPPIAAASPPPLLSSESPPPPPSSVEGMVANAEAKIELAKVSQDALLADISDESTRAKAKLLADAAIAGVKVKKVAMALTAETGDVACAQAFSKMQLDASLGACDAFVSTSRRRRLVADTAYDVTVFMSPATLDETTLAAALESLAAEGVTATSTETDPIEELRAIPGIDASGLDSFAVDAAVAAEATAAASEAETTWVPPPTMPPPPEPPVSPPPPVLVEVDSSAWRATVNALVLCAIAVVLTVMT